MKIDQLQYFLETARTQHIGKASKILNVSPSAISHSLAALEEELGCQLFDRMGKFIYLSTNGKNFATKIEPILQSLIQAKDEFLSDDAQLQGRFKIGATHGLAEISISKQVAMLAVKNPKLVFEFYSLRSAEVVEQVASGLLDFGICFAPTPSPSIKIQQIKKERLMISVKKHHPLKNLKGIKLVNAFADFPFISPKAFAGIEVCEDHPALLKLGVPMNPTFIYDSYDTACSAILNGFYWGLIPECFVKKYSLTSLDVPNFEAHTHLSAVFSKRRTLPKSIQNWIKTISF